MLCESRRGFAYFGIQEGRLLHWQHAARNHSGRTPRGSITIELGGLSKDTVELRGGTVLLCDVLSMSMTKIVVSVAGQTQTYDRNRVKKMILVEREIVQQPAITEPVTKQ